MSFLADDARGGGASERTFREGFAVALEDFLCGEEVTVLVLVLGHAIPDGFGFRRLDERDGAFKQSPSVCRVTS